MKFPSLPDFNLPLPQTFRQNFLLKFLNIFVLFMNLMFLILMFFTSPSWSASTEEQAKRLHEELKFMEAAESNETTLHQDEVSYMASGLKRDQTEEENLGGEDIPDDVDLNAMEAMTTGITLP